MTDRVWIVLTTFAARDDAVAAARTLVDEGLVACAQVEERPITSVYRWEGAVHEDPEILLRLKTTDRARERAVARLAAVHPYDEPQLVWFAADATPGYAAWARAQCGDPDRPA